MYTRQQSTTSHGIESRSSKPPLITLGDLEYVLASVLMFGLRLVPVSRRAGVIGWMSELMGALWHRSNMHNVCLARANLCTLFDGRWSDAEVESHVRRLLTLTAWNSMMIDLLPSLKDEHAAHLLPLEGTHHLDAALERGNGVLLLGAHLGAFAYVIAAALYARHYPVCEVGFGGRPKPGSSLFYQRLYWPRVMGMRQHFNVIDPQDGPQRALLDTLREGKILYLLPDEYFIVEPGQSRSQYLVPVEFLGRTVHVETGGIRLAKRLGAEVFTALPVQEGDVHRVPIEPFAFPSDGTTPQDLAHDMRAFLALLEERVRAQPFLWRDLRRPDLFERLREPTGTL